MALATLTARVEAGDKANFERFCAEVGLSASAAVNVFVKAVLRQKRIPFSLETTTDPFYSESNQSYNISE